MFRNQRKAMIALLPQTHRHSFALWFVNLFKNSSDHLQNKNSLV